MAAFLSPEAAADLDEIWLYITEHSSVETADRFIDRLTDAFLLLAAHPYAGRTRDELREGYRSFPVSSYLVFYRVRGRDVWILRVLHGSRDLDALP
jgi:toxin ParE1/3/4